MLCTYSSCDRLPSCEQEKCLVLGEQQRGGMLSSKLLETSGAVTCINTHLCPPTTTPVCTCKIVCMNRHTDTGPHKKGSIPDHLTAIRWLPDITEMTTRCTTHSSILYAPSQAEGQHVVSLVPLIPFAQAPCSSTLLDSQFTHHTPASYAVCIDPAKTVWTSESGSQILLTNILDLLLSFWRFLLLWHLQNSEFFES